MTFEQWFSETWELMELEGSGRFDTTWDDFQTDLKEAYEAGAAAERERFIDLIESTACVWTGDGYAAIEALRKELLAALEEMK